jgi:hypothetical protein
MYDHLTRDLERAGYRVRTILLPSTGDKPVCKRGTEDVNVIAATIRYCAERGEDIVVVAHGAGGASAGDAVWGLSKAERVDQGKRGGVVKMVYLAAILTEVGQSVSDIVGTRDWVIVHGDRDMVHPARCQEVFFNDVADDRLVTKLKPSATSTRTNKSVYAAWKHIPSSYLMCEGDRVLSMTLQEEMAALPGGRCDVTTIDTGHLPFLARSETAVGFIMRASGKRF